MDLMQQMVGEMRAKPYTMLLLATLSASSGLLWKGQASFASEGQVQALASQVQKVEYTVQKSALENRLAQIETELFNIQQKIADKATAHQSVDMIYRDRINQLQVEKGKVERELAVLR